MIPRLEEDNCKPCNQIYYAHLDDLKIYLKPVRARLNVHYPMLS
jgi:hypothetical protein